MGLSSGCASGSTNMTNMVKKSAPKYQPLLELGEQFTVWDIDAVDNLTSDRFQSITQQLENEGALRVVGTGCRQKRVNRNGHANSTSKYYARIYEWNPDALETLKEVVEDSATLPCGHRGHIRTVDSVNGYLCKYCRNTQPDDERLPYVEQTFDRETVKQSL